MSETVLTLDGNFEQPLAIKTPKVIYQFKFYKII